jgi:hypothetical protein
MKTQLIALIFLLASTPAGASINTAEATPLDMTPQPAAHSSEPVVPRHPKCGEAREMLFILRDPSGSIVAMGLAKVTPSC